MQVAFYASCMSLFRSITHAPAQVLVLRLLTARSVEERICAAAAGKLAVADRSITGGFFDGKTDATARRAYLLDLLREKQTAADGAEHLCVHAPPVLLRSASRTI
jgi:hypothetical protein